jgi:hypothetical protein
MGPQGEMVRRSPGAMAGGIVLISLGAVATIAGVAVFAAANSDCYGSICASDGGSTNPAGVGLMVAGLAGIGIGIPLTIWGARHVPAAPAGAAPMAEPAYVPKLTVGSRTTLSMRF